MRRRTLEQWQAVATRNVMRAQGYAVRLIEELADGDDSLDEDEADSFEQVLDREIAAVMRRRMKEQLN